MKVNVPSEAQAASNLACLARLSRRAPLVSRPVSFSVSMR